jgi:AraC-like DNA-binding protein
MMVGSKMLEWLRRRRMRRARLLQLESTDFVDLDTAMVMMRRATDQQRAVNGRLSQSLEDSPVDSQRVIEVVRQAVQILEEASSEPRRWER